MRKHYVMLNNNEVFTILAGVKYQSEKRLRNFLKQDSSTHPYLIITGISNKCAYQSTLRTVGGLFTKTTTIILTKNRCV